MKNLIMIIVLGLAPLASQAGNYRCASMPDAEEAVARALNLAATGEVAQAVQGEDEYLSGGQYVFRKILVKVGPTSNREMVASYSIVKSFDGPDDGDYCNLAAVETKADVCARSPKLQLCQ